MKIFNLFKTKKEEKVLKATEFIYMYARNSKRDNKYKRKYRNLARHLINFEKSRGIEVHSDNFNYAICEDFIIYLKDLGRMHNTIVSIYSSLLHMYRKMNQSGYKVDLSFNDYLINKESTSSTYLSMQEIKHLYNINVKGERKIVRDLFIIGCLTGMRYSDYSALTYKNIQGNNIIRKTKKTGEVVLIPIHPIIKEIIKDYNGQFPEYTNSMQNFNSILKRLCRDAGFNQPVLWERTVGHNIVRKQIKKFELIGTHTARRSFATNAYLSGIPTYRIMMLTGHKSEQSFFTYIQISKKENAEILSEYDFFK